MKKILIWGTRSENEKYLNNIKYLESIQDIEVTGITSGKNYIYKKINNYKFYKKTNVNSIAFDGLLITSNKKYKEVYKEAVGLGVPQNKIMKAKVLKIPNFSMEKYLVLKKSNISIMANNCWGGLTYHYLNMPFLSPLINMFELDADYIKLLQSLREYLDYPLKLYKFGYDTNLKKNYPICRIHDVNLYMNHYDDFDIAFNKWEERKKRINWDNLFIMMYTTSEAILNEFDKLPYKNKICFVPFKSKLQSAFFVDYHNDNQQFWKIVNDMGSGRYRYYDVLDLLSGVKTILHKES